MFEKFFRKLIFKVLTAIKFISFQRQSMNALIFASIGRQGFFCIGNQRDIPKSLMIIKTTTITFKNQKKL